MKNWLFSLKINVIDQKNKQIQKNLRKIDKEDTIITAQSRLLFAATAYYLTSQSVIHESICKHTKQLLQNWSIVHGFSNLGEFSVIARVVTIITQPWKFSSILMNRGLRNNTVVLYSCVEN